MSFLINSVFNWLAISSFLSCIFLELWSVLSFGLFFFPPPWCTCYMVRGRSLVVLQGRTSHVAGLGTVCGGEVREGTVPLALLSASFQSLLPLHTNKLDSSGADSPMGGFVYILGPCGSLQWTLLWGWEFLPLPQSSQLFQSEVLRLYSPTLEPLCGVSRSPLVLPGLSGLKCGTTRSASCHLAQSSSCCLARSLLHPAGHLCPSYQSGWMFLLLTPWLSDFHTVQLSVSSGCFLFLNLVLSFFWLFKEAQYVYLCLHLGWKRLSLDNVGSLCSNCRKRWWG